MAKTNKEEEKPEVENPGCKCPSCGASLMISLGENDPQDEQTFGKLDEEDQRSDMEKDFNKKMGKLQEY